ncbi:hypothetical protein B4168_0527 [Anoxybacillus flavithermus]|nr:hypothetical protein B4168_0527 [Anoxybacillus flavithermus]OAO86536.1 hypothetical protein GT23_1554 [Parageobacillus thermoglucosidasius]
MKWQELRKILYFFCQKKFGDIAAHCHLEQFAPSFRLR